ncbi:MAG: Holliday junction resolvase RuvX [Thermoanaerobaculia bacterium]
MKALGIDFGSQRVGVAISDPEGRFALPLDTLVRHSDHQIIDLIARIAAQECIDLIVLGEPLQLDGSAGPAADRVRRFGDKLARRTGLRVRLVDEALTSVEATRRLREAGVDPGKHPERVDAVAAQILLQEALDNPRPAP